LGYYIKFQSSLVDLGHALLDMGKRASIFQQDIWTINELLKLWGRVEDLTILSKFASIAAGTFQIILQLVGFTA
jgi:hypothetical protein